MAQVEPAEGASMAPGDAGLQRMAEEASVGLDVCRPSHVGGHIGQHYEAVMATLGHSQQGCKCTLQLPSDSLAGADSSSGKHEKNPSC